MASRETVKHALLLLGAAYPKQGDGADYLRQWRREAAETAAQLRREVGDAS